MAGPKARRLQRTAPAPGGSAAEGALNSPRRSQVVLTGPAAATATLARWLVEGWSSRFDRKERCSRRPWPGPVAVIETRRIHEGKLDEPVTAGLVVRQRRRDMPKSSSCRQAACVLP